ncbi:hypothetical protein IWX90DRAFT_101555 [Phyllosticta citrichinensis]|uniref:Uncharacterized protein n=1 Tax=Phyllosticta citrichinensis TaxID=1130410 RepID=A0ABR1Y1Y3_9PEZI
MKELGHEAVLSEQAIPYCDCGSFLLAAVASLLGVVCWPSLVTSLSISCLFACFPPFPITQALGIKLAMDAQVFPQRVYHTYTSISPSFPLRPAWLHARDLDGGDRNGGRRQVQTLVPGVVFLWHHEPFSRVPVQRASGTSVSRIWCHVLHYLTAHTERNFKHFATIWQARQKSSRLTAVRDGRLCSGLAETQELPLARCFEGAQAAPQSLDKSPKRAKQTHLRA